MKINKTFILSLIVLILLVSVLMVFVSNHTFSGDNNQLKKKADIDDYAGERILYFISPLGESEYANLGVVDLKGVKVNLVTFKTKVLFFQDTEKIYSDLESLLPIKIERVISNLWGKEYITEEYDQKEFTITVRKFEGNKLMPEKKIKTKGQIFNAITLPFYLRGRFDLKIGWNFIARVPEEYKLEVVSIDRIVIPAGEFLAYHFKSIPDKFEIWINKNNPRVPLKIQGKGFFDYALQMKKYTLVDLPAQE